MSALSPRLTVGHVSFVVVVHSSGHRRRREALLRSNNYYVTIKSGRGYAYRQANLSFSREFTTSLRDKASRSYFISPEREAKARDSIFTTPKQLQLLRCPIQKPSVYG